MSRALRCAIYTRKSSEEGLDQAFNSLDAQREACAAYIESQRHEGWTLLPTRYDDGGFSGGNLERPAMQRLLADIAEGKLDLIVVYKVDRLTRSLSDFAKLVEQLDAKNVSFVSVSRAVHVRIDRGRLRMRLGFPGSVAGPETPIDLRQPLRLHRTAHELRLVIPSNGSPEEAAKRDESLVRFIARGRHWYRQITSGEMPSIQAIAEAEGVTERYVARVLRGSLLAPRLMQKILDGNQPLRLSGRTLLDAPQLVWPDQLSEFCKDP